MPVPLSLNTITPIPSAKLSATYNGFKLSFTLDSGATVSFIAHSFVITLIPPCPRSLLYTSPSSLFFSFC